MGAGWQVDEKRKRELLRELKRVVRLCPRLGIKKLFLCGSVARGEVTPGSDLDLLAVQETDLPFMARLEEFYRTVKPRVALDVLIYTPAELEKLLEERAFVRQMLAEGRLVYEEGAG